MAALVFALVLVPAVVLFGLTRTPGNETTLAPSAEADARSTAPASPTTAADGSTAAPTTVSARPRQEQAASAPAPTSTPSTTSAGPTTGPSPSVTPAPAAAGPPVIPGDRSVAARSMQYGIQLYLHEAPGGVDNVDAILDYVVGLGANSLGVTFPIYTDGAQPTGVYTSPETPSPARVADVVTRAHQRGLRVTVRPLIDETNIAVVPGQWRGNIQPVDTGQWLQSYGEVIEPYVTTGADEFVMAAELESLQGDRAGWQALEDIARAVFPGPISYTFNWNGFDPGHLPSLDAYGVDLYAPADLGDEATIDELTYALVGTILATPEQVRSGLVVHELGIPALSGAYRMPWNWGTEGGPIREEIQANWFTAACRAIEQTGLHGLYFWMLDSNIDPLTSRPQDQPPSSFVGRLGEASIRDCFA